MTRITLITLGQTGAGPVYSLEMAKALANNNECELQVIISEGLTNLDAWKQAFAGSNVELNIVKAYGHSKLSVMVQFFNFRRKYKIVKLIKQFKPDVLYVPFGLLWARFIYMFLPNKVKIVSTIHDFKPHDLFDLAYNMSAVLTCGSGRCVNGLVILNEKDKKAVEDKCRRPVVVIPHASFSYYFDNAVSIESRNINKVIGFFGRIAPYKGLDLLVESFEKSQVKDLKLLIAGSGTIPDDLLGRIQSNDKIELINRYISDEEFQPLLDRVDFVVLPYKRASQSGVIPMCFAYGKTVIATDVGALKEQIPEGTGILTSPDSKAISAQIDYLYSNPDLIGEFGKNAKDYAEKELSWNRSAELLINFIQNL